LFDLYIPVFLAAQSCREDIHTADSATGVSFQYFGAKETEFLNSQTGKSTG
jgi:hypothetical protein